MTELPPGAQTCVQRHHPERVRGHDAREDARLLPRAVRRATRPAVPDGRRSHRPEQRVRYRLPERLVSEAVRELARQRRRLLPADGLAQLAALPYRLRRGGRAARAERRAPHDRGERGEHQGHGHADAARTTRSATRTSSRSGRRSSRAGFEIKMLNNRLSFDFTGYQKRTKDALISAIIAPSGRHGRHERPPEPRRRSEPWSRGAVRTRRSSTSARSRSTSRSTGRRTRTSCSTSAARRRRSRPSAVSPRAPAVRLVGSADHWLRGQEQRRILTSVGCGPFSQNDTAACELTIGDSSVFRGYTQPRHLVTATPGFEFLNRKLRLSGAVRLSRRPPRVQQHRAHPLRQPPELQRA